MHNHLEIYWPDLSKNQTEVVSNFLVDQKASLLDFLDVFVYDYAKANDSTIDLSEMEDEDDTEWQWIQLLTFGQHAGM